MDHDDSRRPEDGSKIGPRRPKMAPERIPSAPRRRSDASRRLLDSPRRPQASLSLSLTFILAQAVEQIISLGAILSFAAPSRLRFIRRSKPWRALG